MHSIAHANIKDWAKNYEGELFDGILCDPPYELGFMGKSWDSSGIAFDTDMWADLFKLVKPGGHLLAFSGSRTYHRMAVAIEDAGFEIRDMIEWVYGSGFPKSLNIGKAVDKIQGNEREVTGKTQSVQFQEKGYEYKGKAKGSGFANEKYWGFGNEVTKGTSPYEGYGTALKPAHEPCVLARKPIDKGMTVANNVLKHGTGGLNIDGTRVGTEDIKTSGGRSKNISGDTRTTKGAGMYAEHEPLNTVHQGRFPANFIHDGSDEVEAVFPQTGKSRPDHRNEPSSTGDSGIYGKGYKRQPNMLNDSGSASRFFMTCKDTQKHAIMNVWNDINVNSVASNSTITLLTEKIVNISSALRLVPLNIDLVNRSLNAFFVGEKSKSTEIDFVAKLVAIKEVPEDTLSQQELKAIQDFMQNSGNSTQSQSHVSDVENKDSIDITKITVNLLKLCGYVLRVIDESTKQVNRENASDQATETRFLYTAKASKSERNAGLEGFEEVEMGRNQSSLDGGKILTGSGNERSNTRQNHHPTVKPLSLTKYLATLIKPPTGGRLLVPFSGSGSEMIGALQAGWEYVEGVELTEEYIPIAEARIAHWVKQPVQETLDV